MSIKINTERKRLGSGLFRLAVQWSEGEGSAKEREEAIKATKRRRKRLDGRHGIRYIREQVEMVADMIKAARAARQSARRPPHGRKRAGINGVVSPVLLPSGSLDSRLRTRVDADISSVMRRLYRLDSAGDLAIRITRNPAEVCVVQDDCLDWNYYSKRTRYPKKIVSTKVTVPAAWWSRVRRHGLEVEGGMLTMDAQRAEGAPPDVDLFAATWLRQGRGYELHSCRGYVARGYGESYHGRDPQSALRGLNRKLTGQRISAEMQDLLAKHGIAGLVERHPDLKVSVTDASDTGSCEYGIRSWCERCGLPYEMGEAPLSQVWEGYRRHPMPEARAAILHALRRQKRAVLRAA